MNMLALPPLTTTPSVPLNTDIIQTKHICEVCGKVFLNKPGLTRHLKIHIGHTPYNCELCSTKFVSMKSLKEHQLLHHNPKKKPPPFIHSKKKQWPCDRCKKCFPLKDHRDTHVLTCVISPPLLKDGPYACITCGMLFQSQDELTDHAQVHSFLTDARTWTLPDLTWPTMAL